MTGLPEPQPTLFPVPTTAAPRLDGTLSPDARRTLRQREQIERGIHPATRLPLAGNGLTCRSCFHAVRLDIGSRCVWKCERHRLGISRSAASDIRVSWPACTEIQVRP